MIQSSSQDPCLYHLSWPWFSAKSCAQLHSASPNSCSNSYVHHWIKPPNANQNNTTFLQQLGHFCQSNSMPSCSISTVGRFPGFVSCGLETVLERKVNSTDRLQPQRPIFPPHGSLTRTPDHPVTMRQLPPVISRRQRSSIQMAVSRLAALSTKKDENKSTVYSYGSVLVLF